MSKQINEFNNYRAELDANPIESPKAVWEKIEEFLYLKDKNGNWVRNENGKRVLAWSRIILKMWTLIALLVERIQQHESEQGARGGVLGEATVVKPDDTKTVGTGAEAVLVKPDETKRALPEEPNKGKKNKDKQENKD